MHRLGIQTNRSLVPSKRQEFCFMCGKFLADGWIATPGQPQQAIATARNTPCTHPSTDRPAIKLDEILYSNSKLGGDLSWGFVVHGIVVRRLFVAPHPLDGGAELDRRFSLHRYAKAAKAHIHAETLLIMQVPTLQLNHLLPGARNLNQ